MVEKTVDARGKLCPVPLVMTKKVYDSLAKGEAMTTIVDNDTSAKNVATFVQESGGRVEVEKQGDVSKLHIVRGESKAVDNAEEYCSTGLPDASHVVYISRNRIGNGEPKDLGAGLMQAFLSTLKDISPLPSHVIFMHNGVKLIERGSKTAEIVADLAERGVIIVACGTCLDYFGLMDKQDIAKVSNMYDILSLLTKAGKCIAP